VTQKVAPTREAVILRVPAATKAELAAVAKEHNRSVSAELRQAVDNWLDLNRREMLAAWREEATG
jgi:Arc-like DNA binding domain